MSRMLDIQGLSKDFVVHRLDRIIRGCRDVSMTIAKGEFVGITGRSGSGKSTILKIIHRSYLPQEGRVLYDSERFGQVDLCRVDERRMLYLRRREIGYVSQFLNVIPRTTALETVEAAAMEMEMGREEARSAAIAMLEHFELDRSLWDGYASTFSGGEKLRLNIARAMVKKPRLLLLDEPTASLDTHSKGRVRSLIQRLKAGGTTMLGIFHDLDFMEGLCDKEYSMSSGRLSEAAP